ncbi:MAG TPA: ribosomal protein S18-alanine N-acetyltransferase [Thermodesulfovibrionales bacterium]|nr:ribosomal protein S18-alanine N-acetyltransferase [Thermodesulfovibrionales bacterium]
MVRKTVMEFVIDEMRPEDVPEVLSIERASFTTPWSGTLFMNEIYKPLSLPKVARAGGRIVGYICANQVLDEGHILNVTVHPEHRGQGMAQEMVRHIVGLLEERSCTAIFLEVRVSNEAALRMYERAGFRMITVRKHYYTSPEEDAVIMALNLREDKT